MTPAAALWMLCPRSPRIQRHWLLGIFLERRTDRGSLALGARAAAYTYFSAIFCIRMSIEVMTWYPPVSTLSQLSGVSGQRILARSLRTCHTKCGAFQLAETSGVRTTGSSFAASYSAAVCFAPVRTARVFMSSRM